MNPTKEETDATLARIQVETDQVFFRDLGNHNRALARDRIAEYRAERLPSPTITQYRSVVRGGEYRSASIPWTLIFLAVAIFLIGYAVVRSI